MNSSQRTELEEAREVRSEPAVPMIPPAEPPRRPRGRPALMNPLTVLERIRQLANRSEGLFRIHHTHSGLYARARRQFGSWSAAVHAAGLDYGRSVTEARERSLVTRRKRRRQRIRPVR